MLRNLLFWGAVLAKNEKTIRIETGNQPIVLNPVPASAQLDRGIAFDEIRIKALFALKDGDLEKAATEIQTSDEAANEGDEGDDDTPFE